MYRFAPAAFRRSHQGGFFAADKGAGADADFKIKRKIAAKELFTQKAPLPRFINGIAEPFHRDGIFGPNIDISFIGAHGKAADHHRFDYAVGIPLQDAAIHKSAGVPFVGIADDVFLPRGGLRARFPF